MNLEQARSERDASMARALEHAESVTDNWGEIAYQFLTSFAMNAAGNFTSEDVSDAASQDMTFPVPVSPRAWGVVYQRAARDGWIKQVGFSRAKRRHASVCPLWSAA